MKELSGLMKMYMLISPSVYIYVFVKVQQTIHTVYTFVNISTVHKIQALGQPWFWMICLNDGGHASEKSSVLLPSQDTKVV